MQNTIHNEQIQKSEIRWIKSSTVKSFWYWGNRKDTRNIDSVLIQIFYNFVHYELSKAFLLTFKI